MKNKKRRQGEKFISTYKDVKIYSYTDIDYIIDEYLIDEPRTRGKITYYDCPCSFDIETTSFIHKNNKYGTMYIWQMCLNGAVLIGREWQEFVSCINRLAERLETNENRRLLIYVHNLSFEFQWIQSKFSWLDVFKTDDTTVLKAITDTGIEFRCSYILSGYGLEKTCESLLKYKVDKKVGDLDYSKKRHSKTPLTDTELGYCINDVIGVCCFIQEEIERNGNIGKIPLTLTGYVRRLCRDYCFGDKDRNREQRKRYERFIGNMTIEPEEYKLLHRAFAGGDTHGNARVVGRNLYNIHSYDETSEYPACLVAFKFPMSKGKVETINGDMKKFKMMNSKYLTVFDIEFKNIREKKDICDNIISISRCFDEDGKELIRSKKKYNIKINNGRVICSDYLKTTITNIDFEMIEQFYEWDSVNVDSMIYYYPGYLPLPFIEAIRDLYIKKTALKGVEGMEEEYSHSKGMLNALYGMLVTAICKGTENLEEQIKLYNENKNRFSHYAWGVFCTSYARRNLQRGKLELGQDYCYGDTDSLKFKNYEAHKKWFEDYNVMISKNIEKCLKWHNLNIDSFNVKTKKGDIKPLGWWDYEGEYQQFKTLGAKRYAIHTKHKGKDVFSITVAGINKKTVIPYMLDKENVEYIKNEITNEYEIVKGNIDNVFDLFDIGLKVPADYSGKTVLLYSNNSFEATLKDYLGKGHKVAEDGYIWLGNSEYEMKIADDFEEYLDRLTVEMLNTMIKERA